MLTNGVLRHVGWRHPISLSAALRFCLLSEMMRLAETGSWPDLVEQCRHLALAGWGFAGDIPQWDGILRCFSQDPSLPDAMRDLGVEYREISRNSSIADLRQRAPKTSSIARLEISAARVSRHFEAFAVSIARHLLSVKLVDSVSMADLFVTLAWGYPGKSPVPSELALAMGRARIEQWIGRDTSV